MQASGRAVASFLPVKGFSRAGFWLLAGAGTALAGFGASQLPLAEWAQVLRGWIEELGVLGFVAFGAAYIAAAVLLIPVWPLSISGGLLFGLWGFVWVPLSATLGAMAAFLISQGMTKRQGYSTSRNVNIHPCLNSLRLKTRRPPLLT